MSAPNIKLAFALAQAATAAMRREKRAIGLRAPAAWGPPPSSSSWLGGLASAAGRGIGSALGGFGRAAGRAVGGRSTLQNAARVGLGGALYGGYRVGVEGENPYAPPGADADAGDLLKSLKANRGIVEQTTAPMQDAYTNALLNQDWSGADKMQKAMQAGRFEIRQPYFANAAANAFGMKPPAPEYVAPGSGFSGAVEGIGRGVRNVGHALFPNFVDPAAPSFQDAQKNVTGLMSQAAKHYQQLGGTQASAPARITQAMSMLQQRINSGMVPPQQLAAMQAQLTQLEQLRSTLVATPETSQMQELGRMLQAGGYGQPTPPPMQPIPQQTPPAPLRWGAP